MHDELVKIGDFGSAKKGFKNAQTCVGSPVTMAPELYLVQQNEGEMSYCSKADLWSIGVVFF